MEVGKHRSESRPERTPPEKEWKTEPFEPSYTLLPVVHTPYVNPGDTVEMSLFLSGSGNVDKNKLDINHNHPAIIAEDPGIITSHISDAVEQTNHEFVGPAAGFDIAKSQEMNTYGMYINLARSYFIPDIRHDVPDRALPPGVAEQNWESLPPISYELNIDKEAPPGNYKIFFTLSYENDGVVHQDQKTVEIHVRNWVERNRTALRLIGIAGTLIAFFSLVFSAFQAVRMMGV